jgi:hypothetical protein
MSSCKNHENGALSSGLANCQIVHFLTNPSVLFQNYPFYNLYAKIYFLFVPKTIFSSRRIEFGELHKPFLVEWQKRVFRSFFCQLFAELLWKTRVLTPKRANVIIKLHDLADLSGIHPNAGSLPKKRKASFKTRGR